MTPGRMLRQRLRVPRPCLRVICGDRTGVLIYTHDVRHNSSLFTFSCGPLRFDLHYTFHARNIVAKAAPRPIFGSLYQSSRDRITMDVS